MYHNSKSRSKMSGCKTPHKSQDLPQYAYLKVFTTDQSYLEHKTDIADIQEMIGVQFAEITISTYWKIKSLFVIEAKLRADCMNVTDWIRFFNIFAKENYSNWDDSFLEICYFNHGDVAEPMITLIVPNQLVNRID